MIKYEELPKKFRLKFGAAEWYEHTKSKVNITRYPSQVFKSDDFTKDSLIFAMIEKGVLTVEPLVQKHWRVFLKTTEGNYFYGKFGFSNYWWYDSGKDYERFKSLEEVKEHFPHIEVAGAVNCVYWTIYAEEVGVDV